MKRAWNKPVFDEQTASMEVTSYASATLTSK